MAAVRAQSPITQPGKHLDQQRAATATRFPLTPVAQALLGLLLSAALWAPAPSAWAQGIPAAADARRSFDVPAGSLDQALSRFGRQAGAQIAVNAELTAGLKSPGATGSLTEEEALRQVLAGTGLQAVRDASGEYTLRKAPALSPSDATLPEVRVRETTLPAVTAKAKAEVSATTQGSGSYRAAGPSSTATGLALTQRETPQSISVITREKIDDYALSSLNEVLEQMPGVHVSSLDSERTTYSARGFGIENFQYDGVPTTVNSAFSAGNNLSSTAIYDRVEVLKGAAGLLTGAGQPGAIINLVRKKPTATSQKQVRVGAGSWDNYSAELDVSAPLSTDGRIRGRGVVAFQDQHSFLDGSQRKTSVLYGMLEADLTPDTLLSIGLDYQNTDPQRSSWSGTRPIYDRYGNRISLPRSYNSGANWSGWEQTSGSAFASLTQWLSDRWKLQASLTHQYNGYDAKLGSIQSGPFADGTSTIFANKYVGRTNTDTFDFAVDGSFSWLGREHELVLGGQVSRAHWTGTTYANVSYPQRIVSDFWNWNGDIPEPLWGTPSSYQDETTRQEALYAATRLSATDSLKVLLGGRFANYRYTAPNSSIDFQKNGNLVPYAGLVYEINKNISWYASYTTIFKPQSYRDVSGNLIDPLEGRSYETGLKGDFFDGALNASAAYFEIHQENYPEQLEDTYAPDGNPAYRGIQGVKAKGFEAEVTGALTRNSQLQGSFTHVKARQDGKLVSTTAPANQFKLYASYRADALLPGLKLGGGGRWQSRTYQTIMNYGLGRQEEYSQSAYAVFDLMARHEISSRLTAGLKINNVFDKAYRTNIGFYRTTSYGEPRNIHLNLTYKF
jgi:outer membrane receptor for ferric coprogen and ferric-rhodotorulic acid